jgi:hypothetical protein
MLQVPESTEIPVDFHEQVLQALEHEDRPVICAFMRQVLYEAHLQFTLAEDIVGSDLIDQARNQMAACIIGQAPECNLFELFRQIGERLKEYGEETNSFVCELLAKSFAAQDCGQWPCFSPTVPDALYNGDVDQDTDSADAEIIDLYSWVSRNTRACSLSLVPQ